MAVEAAALAIWGRDRIPAAAKVRDPRIADRRLMLSMAVFLPCLLTVRLGVGSSNGSRQSH
jgi:hypothetical protein